MKPLRAPLSFRRAGSQRCGCCSTSLGTCGADASPKRSCKGADCISSPLQVPVAVPPTAASARCRRCRGGAGSPPAALGAGPLASAVSSPLRLSAGQASYFCRCNSRAEPGAACCPPLSVQLVTTLNTPRFRVLLTLPACPLALRARRLQAAQGRFPLPESHGLAQCCRAGGGTGRADGPQGAPSRALRGTAAPQGPGTRRLSAVTDPSAGEQGRRWPGLPRVRTVWQVRSDEAGLGSS